MADLETDDLSQLSQQPHGGGGGGDDVDLSDETQDFRFLGTFAQGAGRKTDPTIPKRGEKDFAPDGTHLQSRILNDSRSAMHNALSGQRQHTSRVNVHITWRREIGKGEVMAVKGTHFKTMGRADKQGTVWLEREEVVYLVERGGVECWWEEGVPMSLQGCYAECLGGVEDGGVGWIERYQVYAYLKRAGYIVQRADSFLADTSNTDTNTTTTLTTPLPQTYHPPLHPPPLGLFPTLTHRLLAFFNFHPPPPSTGPVISPRTPYRNYTQIYTRLSLIPSHNPSLSTTTTTNTTNIPTNPFPLTYRIYKPNSTFKNPPPPSRLPCRCYPHRKPPTHPHPIRHRKFIQHSPGGK
ncbi:tRNA-splicing endonuclease subunit sen54 N-term-domain-containing protein [Terfezia claveryi]|nr:tRNA-splicing endonuclease subunit sen54 N-term-domain-containing protein [Terfezia claveryi]